MKKLGIASLAALLIMLLSCFAPLAMATEYWGVDFEVNGNGLVWRVDISEPVWDVLHINSMILDPDDINTISFTWVGYSPGEGGTLTPIRDVATPGQLILLFAKDQLPTVDVQSTGITITTFSGHTVYYAGPGFAYRWG